MCLTDVYTQDIIQANWTLYFFFKQRNYTDLMKANHNPLSSHKMNVWIFGVRYNER